MQIGPNSVLFIPCFHEWMPFQTFERHGLYPCRPTVRDGVVRVRVAAAVVTRAFCGVFVVFNWITGSL